MNTRLLKIKSKKEEVFRLPEAQVEPVQSKRMAGLVGPVAAALGLTETLNLHIWTNNLAQVTYLNGSLLFVASIAILRTHNTWKGWPVLMTLAG